MDIHPDATMSATTNMSSLSLPMRVDGAESGGEETAAHLRARLLKMIVENEKARQRSSTDASKPR